MRSPAAPGCDRCATCWLGAVARSTSKPTH